MCDQVVTVQHVDDIDEVHQLDPVHQVDHKDELWGDPGANFCCFFFEIITFCALVGTILMFSLIFIDFHGMGRGGGFGGGVTQRHDFNTAPII